MMKKTPGGMFVPAFVGERVCRYLLSLLFVAAVSAVHAQPAVWEPRGMGGGGALFSPSISPFHAGEIYIACDMTDLFHTTDMGLSWNVVPFTEIRCVPDSKVAFTSDPSILYTINFDFKNDLRVPVKSTDGGRTWFDLPNDPTQGEVYYLYADPGTTQRLIVTSYDRVFFSGNGGSSFREIYSNNNNDGAYVGGAFWDGGTIVIGTSRGLLVSTDNGASFTLASISGIPSSEGIVSFTGAAAGGKTRFMCVTLGLDDIYPRMYGGEHWGFKGIYVLDGLSSQGWVKSTQGLSQDDHPFFVSMAGNNLDIAYVAGGNGATYYPIVFKTTNGGKSWFEVFKTRSNQNIFTGWSGYRGDSDWWFGEYALGFEVSPVNPDVAVITDLGFPHATTDGGRTWRQMYVHPDDQNPMGTDTPKGKNYRGAGLENTSAWWVTWIDAKNIFVGFTDITGIRSTDGGRYWSRNYQGLDYNSVYCVLSLSGGKTLVAATSSVHDIYESMFLDDNLLDGTGEVMISTDKGTSWQTLHDFKRPVVWLTEDPQRPNTLYASVVHRSEGGIYVSSDIDRGKNSTWKKLAEPPRTEGHPLSIRVLNDGTIVCSYSGRRDSRGAFTPSSGVFVSTDNGASWIDRSDQGMLYWTRDLVVDPHDSQQNTWYACVFSGWGGAPNGLGGLYRTTDRGKSWTRVSDLDRVSSCAVDPNHPGELYLTTEDQGLWFTKDVTAAQPVFTQVTGYPFKHPQRIFFNPFDSNEIWVTSFGNGLRVGNRRTQSVKPRRGSIPGRFDVAVFPNPVRRKEPLTIYTKRTGPLAISVVNVFGRQVRKHYFTTEDRSKRKTLTIDTGTLAEGVYLVWIVSGNDMAVEKLAVIR